jgi:phage terminase small subunit
MPALKNDLHERFAQAVASGQYRTGTAAYRHAAPKSSVPTARVKACNLQKNPKVQARIDELTGRNRKEEERVAAMQQRVTEKATEKAAEKAAQQLADKIVISREFVIDELLDNLKRAKAGERFDGATANKAAELLGKEIGMFVERSENLNTHYGISDQPMSPEEWIRKHATPSGTQPNAPSDPNKKLN